MNLLTIISWWDSLSTTASIFWAIALGASAIFLFQLITLMIGLDADTDAELEVDADDFDASLVGDVDFALFSIRSIVAFFLFFGWTAVMLLNKDLGVAAVIAISFIAGLVAMSLVAYLLYKMYQLNESGTVKLIDALNASGEVYIPIPASLEGKGKIQITLDNKVMELFAMTQKNQLNTGEKIKVIDILDKNVLLVESLK